MFARLSRNKGLAALPWFRYAFGMETAKLFQIGQSQAVRLPKEFRFSGEEVGIKKVGQAVMLFPKDRAWETHLEGLNSFTDDFMTDGREQGTLQERENL